MFCHIRYQLGIKFSLFFFQYPDHSQSQIEDCYRKRDNIFIQSFINPLSLELFADPWPLNLFAALSLPAVVDPWYLQLFADPLPL